MAQTIVEQHDDPYAQGIYDPYARGYL